MHRNRTWQIDPTELRTQRNRILPIEGGDGSTLNLDFTTGVLDPRLTFSRASTATFVNSSGYVEYAGANMLVNSPMQDAASPASGWNFFSITGGTISIPTTGSRKVATTGASQQPFTHQTLTISQGLTFTLSLVVTEITGTISYQNICGVDGAASSQLWVNGVNITATSSQAAVGNYCLIFVGGSGSHTIRIGTGASSASAGVCSMTFHSARVQPGSFTTTTYIPSTLTAAYHAPRFDYSPTNIGEPRGLLLEAPATNLIRRSQEFSNSAWDTYNITSRTDNAATGPDNLTSATRVVLAGQYAIVYQGVSTTAGVTYTFSFWAKRESGNTAFVIHHNFSATGSNTAFTMTDNWQRYEVSVLGKTGGGFVEWGVQDRNVSGQGTILLWGAQLEVGSGASSYIPTGASQVTRNTDICYADGANFTSWYTQGIGTCLFVGQHNKVGAAHYANFSTGTNAPRVTLYSGGSAAAIYSENTGVNASFSSVGTITTSVFKAAMVFQTGNYLVVLNGGAVASGTTSSPLMASALTRLNIGMSEGQTSQPNGYVRQLKYYPTAFTAAQLQILTTP